MAFADLVQGFFNPKPKDNQSVTTDVADVGVINDSYTSSRVQFPTAWTQRIQTPVKRVPPGKMWSQPERYREQNYGGPQR
jgi:hypothetical protein